MKGWNEANMAGKETITRELLEALEHIWDYSAKQFEANSDERALWAKVNGMASTAIAKTKGGE